MRLRREKPRNNEKLSSLLSRQSEQIIEDLYRIHHREVREIYMDRLRYNTSLAYLFFGSNMLTRKQYLAIKELQDKYLYRERYSNAWISEILAGFNSR